MRAILALLLLLTAGASGAATPTTCGGTTDYEKALCAYQRRNFVTAEQGFRTLVERNAEDPVTVRAHYFLGRTLMKTGRYDEASKLFIRIYVLDKPFYDSWNCDFLLGECRKAVGKG